MSNHYAPLDALKLSMFEAGWSYRKHSLSLRLSLSREKERTSTLDISDRQVALWIDITGAFNSDKPSGLATRLPAELALASSTYNSQLATHNQLPDLEALQSTSSTSKAVPMKSRANRWISIFDLSRAHLFRGMQTNRRGFFFFFFSLSFMKQAGTRRRKLRKLSRTIYLCALSYDFAKGTRIERI